MLRSALVISEDLYYNSCQCPGLPCRTDTQCWPELDQTKNTMMWTDWTGLRTVKCEPGPPWQLPQ